MAVKERQLRLPPSGTGTTLIITALAYFSACLRDLHDRFQVSSSNGAVWLRTHLQQAVTYSNIRRINKWVCIPMMCLSSPHYSALQTESGNIQHHNFFPGSTASTTFPSGAVDFVLRPFGNRSHRPVPTLQARGPELQNRALMKDAQSMRLSLEIV